MAQENGNAKNNIKPAPTAPGNASPSSPSAEERSGRGKLPAGYERVNSAAPVWLVKTEGVTMEGIMLGRFMRKGDQSSRGAGSPYFYQFEVVGKSVEGTVGSKTEDTSENIMVHVGQVVSVDESEALKDLEPFIGDGGKYQVCLVFGKKMQVKGTNRSFWPVEIGKKVITPPPPMAHRMREDRTIS